MSISETTCRLCMNPDAVINLFALDGDTTVDKKIRDCIDLKIMTGDGLPALICKMCNDTINNFYDFKQNCLLVDSKLRTNKFVKNFSNKLTLDDSDILTESIKMECVDLFNKMDLKKAFGSWLSDDTDSECYVEYLGNQVPIEIEDHSQREKLHLTLHNNDKIQVNKPPRKSRKSDTTRPELYQCEICGRILKNKSVLEKHIETHSGIKKFSCKICSKTFTRADHKVVHMRIHLGIKPYICDKCGKSFTKRQDMIRHMRIHSDEKKYACPRCDRKFKRSGDVHSHMRTHTGAKPYICHVCDKRYTSHSGLRKHDKTHFKKETT